MIESETDNPFLIIENLSKSFKLGNNEVHALKNINFTVNKGEFITIMGPSGAGKSTLLYLLAGLLEPITGTITFGKSPFSKLSIDDKAKFRGKNIGIVYQFYNLHPLLNLEENLELPFVMAGIPKKLRRERIESVLEITELANRKENFPEELSGGEKQRTAIARALLLKPQIILCDEPTGNLDTAWGDQIIDFLHKINEAEGITILMITHDEDLLRINDRIIEFEDGEIINDFIMLNENQRPKYEFFDI